VVLLVLLVIGLVAGLGPVVHPLYLVAGGLLVVWAAGFVAHTRGRRWYRW
jgi:hypothetical protein